MNQPKPLFTTEKECENCDSWGVVPTKNEHIGLQCPVCKGTGKIKTEYYLLRDFPNCMECNHGRTGFFNEWDMAIKKTTFPELCSCKGTTKEIPFKNYEIKKVSEIKKSLSANGFYFRCKPNCPFCAIDEHNLKESDELVVVRG